MDSELGKFSVGGSWSSVAEADSQAARGAHQRTLQVFGWAKSMATCTHGFRHFSVYRFNRLYADIMELASGKIISILEAITHAEAEIV